MQMHWGVGRRKYRRGSLSPLEWNWEGGGHTLSGVKGHVTDTGYRRRWCELRACACPS